MDKFKLSLYNPDKDLVETLLSLIDRQEKEITSLYGVINHLPISVYWKDMSGKYMGRNQNALESMVSLNLEPEDASIGYIVGKTDYDLFPFEIADNFRKNDLKVLCNKQTIVEERILSKEKKEHVQLSVKSPLYDIKGNIMGIVGNTIDITAQKQLERKLILTKEKLSKVNKMQINMIRNMEHDIRTPLNALLNISNILLSEEYDEKKKEYITYVKDCVNNIIDYCNLVTNYSEVISSSKYQDEYIDLKGFLINIQDSYSQVLKNKKLSLNLYFNDNIPDIFLTSTKKLGSILNNLISKSISFAEQGSEIAILVEKYKNIDEVENDSAALQFTVANKELQKSSNISKVNGYNYINDDAYGGMGVEISIAKVLVLELGGKIEVSADEEYQNKFIFTVYSEDEDKLETST